MNTARPTRRGLTLLELMIGMAITAVVAAGIAAMWEAVSGGLATRRDQREVSFKAAVARSRLAAYVRPALAVLGTSPKGTDVYLWLKDSRQGGTVHLSEVRWLIYDAQAGTIDVRFVHFPDGWTPVARDLQDVELSPTSSWQDVLSGLPADWVSSFTLIDGLTVPPPGVPASVDVQIGGGDRLEITLTFDGTAGPAPMVVSATPWRPQDPTEP